MTVSSQKAQDSFSENISDKQPVFPLSPVEKSAVSEGFSKIYESISASRQELLNSRLKSQQDLLSLSFCPEKMEEPGGILRGLEEISGEMKLSLEVSAKFSEALRASLLQVGGIVGGSKPLLEVFREALDADNEGIRTLLDTGYDLAPETWILVKKWMDEHPGEKAGKAQPVASDVEPVSESNDHIRLSALSLGELKELLLSEKFLSAMKTLEGAGETLVAAPRSSVDLGEKVGIVDGKAAQVVEESRDSGNTEVVDVINQAWERGDVMFLDDQGTSVDQGSAFSIPSEKEEIPGTPADEVTSIFEPAAPSAEKPAAPARSHRSESTGGIPGLPRAFVPDPEDSMEGSW